MIEMPSLANRRVAEWGLLYAFLSLFALTTLALPASTKVLISVDKSTQQMSVSVDGVPRYRYAVSTGRAGYGTPNGTYHPQHLAASWFSKRQCLIRSFSMAATQSTAAMRSIGSADLPHMAASVCTLRTPQPFSTWYKAKVYYLRRWLVWNRVQSLGCQSALTCTASYKQAIDQIIVTSDPRDIQSAGAKVTLAGYQQPDDPGLWQWLTGQRANFASIETALTLLYKVENSVGAAQVIRESTAITKLTAQQLQPLTPKSGLTLCSRPLNR